MELSGIREELGRWAAGFDATACSMADAKSVVRLAAQIQNIAAVVKAQAAARVADSGSHRDSGSRSAAEDLAKQTGISIGQAKKTLETGKRLADQPAVRDAAASGELSDEQVAAVSDAAAAAPEKTGSLLDIAKTSSLNELRDECARVKAAAEPDPEARRKRIHAERSLKHWTSSDGVGHLHWKDNPERIAEVISNLAPAREELFRAARDAAQNQSKDGGIAARIAPDALDADALVETVRRGAFGDAASSAGGMARYSRAKILIRIDWEAFKRGHPVDGEVCEIVGHGPVAVSAVLEEIERGGFVAGIVTKGKQVIGVAHLGRMPTKHQDTALEWLYPTCAAQGCGRTARLQRDHREDWAITKHTLLDELDRFCEHEHYLKTHHGWSLVEGTGKRPFVPPDDPRHPKNQPKANDPPESAAR